MPYGSALLHNRIHSCLSQVQAGMALQACWVPTALLQQAAEQDQQLW